MKKYQLVKFEDNDFSLDVRADLEKETVWLTKEEIGELFDRDRTVISRHINKIYKEGELVRKSTCAKNAHVPSSRNRSYESELFNLDVIISVGYRVKSQRGVLFRKWANKVLKDYLIQGYAVNEKRLIALNKTIDIQNRMLSYSLDIDRDELGKVINEYTRALDLLDSYDHQTLVKPKGSEAVYVLTYQEARNIIDSMKFGNNSSIL